MKFDDLSDFIIDSGKKAVDKAKEAATYAKLTADIKTEEVKLRSMYAEIGKLFCEQETGVVDEAFIPLMEKVSSSKMKISNLELQIQKTKGLYICPECGAEIAFDAKYCSSCGAEFNKKKKSDDTVVERESNKATEEDFEKEDCDCTDESCSEDKKESK